MDSRTPILGDYDLAGPDCITELQPDTVWHIDHPSGQGSLQSDRYMIR